MHFSSPEPIIPAAELAPPSFPIEALGVLAPPAQALVESLQVAEGIAGMSFLTAAALVAQAHVDVVIDDRRYPSSLFGLTIAESGERKTQAEESAMRTLRDWERKQYAHREMIREEEMAEKNFWLNQREQISRAVTSRLEIKNAIKSLGSKPVSSPEPSLTVTSPTFEGLIKSYRIGLPYKGLFTDEGGAFFGGYSMRQETAKVTISGLSKLWDGAPLIRTNAAEGESYALYGRRLSAHVMLQPVIAHDVFDSSLLNEQGFLPRFLFTWPKPKKGTRKYVRSNASEHPALLEYRERMENILAMQVERTPDEGGLDPRPLKLSNDAFLLWEASYNEIEEQLGESEPLSEISAFGSKAPEIAARIAAVLAFVENPLANEIQASHVSNGFAIVRHSLDTLLFIKNRKKTSHELLTTEKIKNWIIKRTQRNGNNVITKREILFDFQPRITAAALDNHTKRLVEKGWLIPILGGVIHQGQRVRDAWTVQPLC